MLASLPRCPCMSQLSQHRPKSANFAILGVSVAFWLCVRLCWYHHRGPGSEPPPEDSASESESESEYMGTCIQDLQGNTMSNVPSISVSDITLSNRKPRPPGRRRSAAPRDPRAQAAAGPGGHSMRSSTPHACNWACRPQAACTRKTARGGELRGVTTTTPMRRAPLLTRLASWRGTGEVVGAETVPEPEGRQSEQQSRDWLSLENGNSRRSGTLAPEHPGRARSSRRHRLGPCTKRHGSQPGYTLSTPGPAAQGR